MKSRFWAWIGVVLAALAGGSAPAAGQDGGAPVTVSLKASKPSVAPGDQLALAIVIEVQNGWHINTDKPAPPPGLDLDPIPTEITVAGAGIEALAPQWPKPTMIDVPVKGGHAKYGVFQGRAVALVPLRVGGDAAVGSPLRVTVTVSLQACDESTCLPPEDIEASIALPVAASGGATSADDDFKAFDATVFAAGVPPAPPHSVPSAGSSAPAEGTTDVAFGWRLKLNLPLVIVLGLLGGFILNLTPCVLPVIPIKIMGLSQAAGHPGRTFFLGVMMSLGVVAFWLFIGVLIAVTKTIGAVSELFANPWFGLSVGAFIAVMALGMMGMYTLRLPQAVYQISPRHDTPSGSVLFGIMTALLGTPCFGPFAGGVAGWASRQSAGVALAAFGSLGLGMALPYLILSARPQWVAKVPRTGPASELVKQVMGLLLMAAGAYFVGSALLGLVAEKPWLGPVIYWWFVALFAVCAGVWLAWRMFRISKSPAVRGVFLSIGLFIVGASVAWAQFQTALAAKLYVPPQRGGAATQGLWREYTRAEYDAALKSGKVVIVDFTAEWCLNCKTLEAAVLAREDVQAALRRDRVVAFKADLTSRKAEGWPLLKELGEVGIPLLAIQGPGFERPWKSNAYTPGQVIAAINDAMAPATTTGSLPAPWQPFSREAYDDGLKAGKVVVVSFSAEWDINCKAIEASVLAREDVREALRRENIVALQSDMTSRKAEGWPLLKELGEVGIPLLAIQGPGFERPWKSNAYTPGQVIAAINDATKPGPVASK